MNKVHLVRDAARKIEMAIENLQRAKADLLHARSDQHIRLALALTELEEVHSILTDPDCTPEITEADLDEIRGNFCGEVTGR